MDIFSRMESEVRSYCRSFPAVFSRAQGAFLFDEAGRKYIDFLSGAGALNYGHNNPLLKRALLRYLEEDGITHSLDLSTTAKREFLERFASIVLQPCGLDYKVQFTGPTGANGVEAALKLARLARRRSNVIAFSHGYHGLSAGALAATANSAYRNEAFVNRTNVSFLPYDGYHEGLDSIEYLRKVVEDPSSGVDMPAAIIVETVQAEGGINIASVDWLRGLEAICRDHNILLIADEIQVGCGRTGTFFSFERAGIRPDLIVLSKSISGFGLPMTLVLIKPELDLWKPGEHTGTFRGNNLAFVTASQALSYWENPAFSQDIQRKGMLVKAWAERASRLHSNLRLRYRGLGMIWGIELQDDRSTATVIQQAFANGLILERCGAGNKVLKILPPLNIEDEVLTQGLDTLSQALASLESKTIGAVMKN